MASFFFQSGEQVDADDSLVVNIQQSATVASHPIESGSKLGDHISPEPSRVVLDLIFTPDAAGRERVFPAPGATRPDTAVSRLQAASRVGEVLKSVLFANQWWDDVALVNVAPSQTFTDGDGRKVQVELQRMTVVEARTITVARVRKKRTPARSIKAKARMTDLGSQPADPVGVFQDQLGIEFFRIDQAVNQQVEQAANQQAVPE